VLQFNKKSQKISKDDLVKATLTIENVSPMDFNVLQTVYHIVEGRIFKLPYFKVELGFPVISVDAGKTFQYTTTEFDGRRATEIIDVRFPCKPKQPDAWMSDYSNVASGECSKPLFGNNKSWALKNNGIRL
jgi:hypothetical protein